MFGELPKIFDRDFAIAFFLPAVIFLVANLSLLAGFDLAPQLFPLLKDDALKDATLLGAASLLFGVFLQVMNYSIYRWLEGYGSYNPAQLLVSMEKRRYRSLYRAIDKYEDDIEYGKFVREEKAVLNLLRASRDKLKRRATTRFPSDEDRILPTAFGNTMRAFEDYPYDMYCVDSIMVWTRLIGVIPKDFRGLIGAAKAETDFWINLWFLGLVALVEYLGFVIFLGRVRMLWLPLVAVLFTIVAAVRARTAAVGWGDYVKASFDLFLPNLRSTLELPRPSDIKREREMWDGFSQMVVYHSVEDVPSRVPVKENLPQEQPTPLTEEDSD